MASAPRFNTATMIKIPVFARLLTCSSLLLGAATSAIADDAESTASGQSTDDNLETIIVTGSPVELTTRPNTQRIIKVAGAGNDPIRSLESLPGVIFSAGREAAPAIRGSSPDDNAYYLDFLPVGYLFHIDGSSIVNDALVQDFQLYPAAFSGEYTGAVGGVITSTSRSPNDEVGQTIVDFSLLRAGLLVESPITENQSFFLSGRISLFQFYLENLIDEEDFEFTTVPEFYDYQGAWEYQLSNASRLRLQLVGARDKAGVDFDEDSDAVLQDPGIEGGVEAEQYFNSQGIIWEGITPSSLAYTIGFSHLEENFDFAIGQGNFIQAQGHRYGIRSQFSRQRSERLYMTWGIEYAEQHIDYVGEFASPACDEFTADCRLSTATETVSGEGTVVLRESTLFLKNEFQINKDWLLTFGPQISYNDYTQNNYIEPKLENRFNLTEELVWTAGYGQYHSLPGNPGQYVEDFGNPDLDETQANHYVTGLEFLFREGLSLTTEVYYKELTDIIVARPNKETFYPNLSDEEYNQLPRFTNDGTGKAWGIEALLNASYADDWYGWVSVAYSRTERTNELTQEDFRYAYDQPLVINLVGNYQLNDNWNIGLKWRYQSGQLITPLEGALEDEQIAGFYNPLYGDPFSDRLPAYHKLDARADRSFNFTHWDMDLYIEAINLYGRDNVVDYSYENADYSEREEVTDLPTLISVGVRAYF